MKYTPVIGLEVHVELKTKSKMFCGCSADHFGKKPNTQTCPVCLGLPGALPVPNRTAIEWCIKIGLALNCDIPLESKFDRKNYFYPDLPKGYQISQYDQPFAVNGWMDIPCHPELVSGSHLVRDSDLRQNDKDKKRVRIRRVHMEEDTGKLIHEGDSTLIDFNRSGVPLVEIVTEPDFDNAADVKAYLQKLQQIVRYLGVSEADMEKGMMRLEPNISLRASESDVEKFSTGSNNSTLPKYKVEVKNINSFRFVEKAINYEIERQAKVLDEGKTPVQETRGWDEKKGITVSQRSKEEAHDYRYFPEPDIPPLQWTEFQISNFKFQMPELPNTKFERFIKEYNLSSYDAEILTREVQTADYFEEAVRALKSLQPATHNLQPKNIANFIINKKTNLEQTLPAQLIQSILSAIKVATVDEKHLKKIVEDVIIENPNAVADFKKGNEKVMMFLIGQVMQKLKEKVDIKEVRILLQNKLK